MHVRLECRMTQYGPSLKTVAMSLLEWWFPMKEMFHLCKLLILRFSSFHQDIDNIPDNLVTVLALLLRHLLIYGIV